MKHLATLRIGHFSAKIIFNATVFGLTLTAAMDSFAQENKKIDCQKQLWYGYHLNWKINKEWFAIAEIQERHFVSPLAQSQLLGRVHLHKNIGAYDAGVGMSLFFSSPNNPNETERLVVPEMRPHVEFNTVKNVGFGTVHQRYKVEARYFHNSEGGTLANGYYFGNFRLRMQLGLRVPIVRNRNDNSNKMTVKVQEEILLNAGRRIVKNVFDQNRIYVALDYNFSKTLSVEMGYLNWFQQQSSGTKFYDRDIIRFTIYQKIN